MPHRVSGINSLVLSVNLFPVPLSLTCLFLLPYHLFSLCQLTTLTINNSGTLALPAQNVPLPQIFPTIDFLSASGLTPRILWLEGFFWASSFLYFLHYCFCLMVLCGRLSRLFVDTLSYRIIPYLIWCNQRLRKCPPVQTISILFVSTAIRVFKKTSNSFCIICDCCSFITFMIILDIFDV